MSFTEHITQFHRLEVPGLSFAHRKTWQTTGKSVCEEAWLGRALPVSLVTQTPTPKEVPGRGELIVVNCLAKRPLIRRLTITFVATWFTGPNLSLILAPLRSSK